LSVDPERYLTYFSAGVQVFTMPAIKIVLVDDHQIILDGLSMLLDEDPSFDVMASFSHPEKALSFLSVQEPDVLLTDYSLPGISGLDLIRKAKVIHPSMKAALLSMHDEPSIVREAIKVGVNGYLLKNIQQAELKEAIRKIYSGLIYISAEITTQLLQQPGNSLNESYLTERELEVLKLITKENSNKQIAEKMHISERTVETHRKNIFRKTGTTSLVGLVKYAYTHNLVS
jgi:two-component system nitrate/nitrite response regulator NarL